MLDSIISLCFLKRFVIASQFGNLGIRELSFSLIKHPNGLNPGIFFFFSELFSYRFLPLEFGLSKNEEK